MTHLECNPQMQGKISHQGGLQLHESEIEMALPQSNFCPLPKSFQCTPITHPRRVLPRLWLQPQIRHPVAQWSSPTKNQDPPQNSSPNLRRENDLGSGGHLARLKALLPLWLACTVKRLAWRTKPKATFVDQSGYHRSAAKTQKARTLKRLYGRTKPGTLLKHHIPITPQTVSDLRFHAWIFYLLSSSPCHASFCLATQSLTRPRPHLPGLSRRS